tara:strand:+ start:1532 stop:2611 length:1080 start_codon:yes stop_codon:yes gene_type:complete
VVGADEYMKLENASLGSLGHLADPQSFHGALNLGEYDPKILLGYLRRMLVIRRTEEVIGIGIENGQVRGPAHLAIGQEAVAVGVCENLRASDRIFGAHRSHAHYLGLGGDLYRLLAEVLGRDEGCSRGMGGSMHLQAEDVGLLGTVPIVAGTIGLAVGAALAAQKDGRGDVAVAFFGDGACEEGALHESLNLASAWHLPIVFVCENNLFSSHMHISLRQPNDRIARYADAHRIPSATIDGNDLPLVLDTAREMVAVGRDQKGPTFLEAVTYRWRGHVGPREDEDVGVRRGTDLPDWKKRDPVRRLAEGLENIGALDQKALKVMEDEVTQEVEASWAKALEADYPEESALLDRVYARPSS